jgi:hypothetical protein
LAQRRQQVGPGSSLEQTAVIRDQLPKLIAEPGINSVLDIPCGDLQRPRRHE